MPDIYAVLTALKSLAPLESEEEAGALALCAAAAESVAGKLRDPACKNVGAVIRAAAGLAFYDLLLGRYVREPDTDFKAGDLSVGRKPDLMLKAAARQRDFLLRAAAPYLEDENFLFRGV
ncbi:MAG: hypothetical protein GX345_07135 [Clostridiales bacterium]|jgi:hypothetical protein|nr:hypothetical protein [Clostridiales bacterium]